MHRSATAHQAGASTSTAESTGGSARRASAMRSAPRRYDGSSRSCCTAGSSGSSVAGPGSSSTARAPRSATSAMPAPTRATASAFARLIGAEERDDHDRHPVPEGAERRSVAAVADDRRGGWSDGIVGNPALDVDVGRQGAQLAGVAGLADGHEDAGAQWGQRLDRRAVQVGVVRQVGLGGHGAEGQVDERVVAVGPPPGRGRLSGGLLVREAADAPRRRDRRVLERLGDDGEVGRVAQPVAARIGRQAQLGARRVDPRRRLEDGPLLDGGEAEGDAHGARR